MKTCRKCGESKPVTSFYTYKKTDGTSDPTSRCRACICLAAKGNAPKKQRHGVKTYADYLREAYPPEVAARYANYHQVNI